MVTNGTKQGCVMARLLFTLVFSVMLNDAFHDNDWTPVTEHGEDNESGIRRCLRQR